MKTLSGVLNLNNATMAQLLELPGVSLDAAKQIAAYRRKKPFACTEDLLTVKGFGKKKLEKLKAHLTVSGPTTLTVLQERLSPTTREILGIPDKTAAMCRYFAKCTNEAVTTIHISFLGDVPACQRCNDFYHK